MSVCQSEIFKGKRAFIQEKCPKVLLQIPLSNHLFFYNHFTSLLVGKRLATYGHCSSLKSQQFHLFKVNEYYFDKGQLNTFTSFIEL